MMTRKDIITYAAFLAIGITGIIVAGFGGGFIAGMATTLLLFVSAGRRQLNRAGKLIDKRINDHLQTNTDGNENPKN